MEKIYLLLINGILLASSKKVPGGVSKSYQVDPDVVWTFTTTAHPITANTSMKEAHLLGTQFTGDYKGDRAIIFQGGTEVANTVGSTRLTVQTPNPVTTPLTTTMPAFTGNGIYYTSDMIGIYNTTVVLNTATTQPPAVAVQVGTKVVIIEEACYQMSKAMPTTQLTVNTTSLGSHDVDNIMSCAKLCKDNAPCSSFWTNSSSVEPGVCVLGNPDYAASVPLQDMRYFAF